LDLKRDNDSTHSALVAHLRELGLITPAYQQKEALPTAVAASKKEKTPNETASKKSNNEKGYGDLKKLETGPKPTPDAKQTALLYADRKKSIPQLFDVTADSLVLSFYDNGVVDGDVISVYVNGSNIISNAKLFEAATKITIHLPADTDSVELLLVAETLGSIPPNTGLLIVQDGSARYEVRFSADLQTNAAIVFRKRK
ncbi:MAG TPA: hypothetical protein VM010_08100, partial [Chitinophagaceae bacterium]|nr:hypothetical protein [Chitinophagaceae bacterium]